MEYLYFYSALSYLFMAGVKSVSVEAVSMISLAFSPVTLPIGLGQMFVDSIN